MMAIGPVSCRCEDYISLWLRGKSPHCIREHHSSYQERAWSVYCTSLVCNP